MLATARSTAAAFLAGVLLATVVAGANATSSGGLELPPPSFRPADGWWTLTTGRGSSELAPQAWAVTERDAHALVPFALERGLRRLRPDGIVIWASTAGRGGPLGVFRRSEWPLRLSGFRVDRTWEGRPTPRHQRRLRWAATRGWRLDVRVYFGTQHPSARLLTTAQEELARLRLPGR